MNRRILARLARASASVPALLFSVATACGPAPTVRTPDLPRDPPQPPSIAPAASGASASTAAADKEALEHASRVAAALARVPVIAQTVAEIRQLALKRPIPAAVQSQDDFRAFLDKEVAKEMPPEKSAASVRALVRLGFLKQSIDLNKTVEDAMLSQAGAYYDPQTKKFYLVIVPEDESMLDVMSAHELTHALDDEYFDLDAYTDDPKHLMSNDVQQARRMVAEGEATLVMLAYQAKVAAQQDIFDPRNRAVEKTMVSMFAQLDSEALAKAATDNPGMVSQMGPSMKASIDAMTTIPPFILDPLFGAYTKGCAAVAAVRDAGGWDAVAKLYADPPESTEQLLHPLEKLVQKRDHPVNLTFPPAPKLLAGLTPLDTDVIGEMTMAVYFKNWGSSHPTREVLGWGGDRYAAYDVGGRVVAVWFTTWDTVEDATRFAKAYDATLRVRFPGEKHASAGSVVHGDGTVTTFTRTGKDVVIVDGAREADAHGLLNWLAKSTRTQAK